MLYFGFIFWVHDRVPIVNQCVIVTEHMTKKAII